MPPVGITVVATLDLHGFRKEAAIRQLTLFLEEAVRRRVVVVSRPSPNQQRRQRRTADDDEQHDHSFCHPRQEVWVSVITGTGSHSQNGTMTKPFRTGDGIFLKKLCSYSFSMMIAIGLFV
jgi:hypothetical protein